MFKALIFTIIIPAIFTVDFTSSKNLSRKRAKELLSQMTLDEKISMLHGHPNDVNSKGYVGYVSGIERLNIPALKLSDAGNGFRDNDHPGTTTCWPSALAMGSTFDVELSNKFGIALGEEFFDKGSNVLLGPGLNLARVPLNGRNFEYLSGGDPYLGKSLVGPLIKGIQSKNVIATAKHWVLNNQVFR